MQAMFILSVSVMKNAVQILFINIIYTVNTKTNVKTEFCFKMIAFCKNTRTGIR